MKKTIEQRAKEIWNESAFVVPFDAIALGDKGMTKGEYFAAMALQGMLGSPKFTLEYAIEQSIIVARRQCMALALAEMEVSNG